MEYHERDLHELPYNLDGDHFGNPTTIRFYTEYFTETLCINSTHIQQPENDFRRIYIIHTNLFDDLENLTLRHSTMLRPIFVTIDPDDVYQFRRVKQEP